MVIRFSGAAPKPSRADSSRSDTWTAGAQIDPSRHLSLVVLGDCIIGATAYVLAFLVRSWMPIAFTTELLPAERFSQVKHYWWLIIALQPLLLFFLDTYHEIRQKRLREFALSAWTAGGIQALILIAVYFFSGNLAFPRSIFPVYWVLNSTGVVFWRLLIKSVASLHKRRALVVGSGALTEQLIQEIRRAPEIGLQVVGIVCDQLPKGRFVEQFEVLGDRNEIVDLIQAHRIDEVILTPEASWKDHLVDAIGRLEASRVRISLVPSVYEILIGRIRHFNIRDIPLIEVVGNPNDPVAAFSRRMRDLVFGSFLIFLLLPIWLVVALAIKISDGGSPFYSQVRIGQWGRRFRLYKFRTMPEGAEDETGPILARADDPRLNWLGRFLRSYRIDESLQLINVIRGEMSLVGPRPDRPEFVERFAQEIHGYTERHRVKPGITGLAQIRGHYLSDPAIKLKYDLAYVHNSSFVVDMMIFLETIRIVFRRQGV